ncbi:hypothetical protein HPB50_002906 [Hyalomma asiaticum]|uniref:Uncharacterized protein n=1 Tax=Hyalomma asiaticum TaxID=266040 RepID=A0ACB7THS0_HYAAI|nr:hypothetical protein HPB50_002906 [Hyalomma asiaticum]
MKPTSIAPPEVLEGREFGTEEQVVRSTPTLSHRSTEHLHRDQANDGESSVMLQYCPNRWPWQFHLPLHVKRYWQYQGDLRICEGMLLKVSRITVLSAFPRRTLKLCNDGPVQRSNLGVSLVVGHQQPQGHTGA